MAEIQLGADLAYLRRLARAGREGPPLGGALLAGFGGFIGAGCGAVWLNSVLRIPFSPMGMEFIAGLLVFAALSSWGDPAKPRLRRALAWGVAATLGFWAVYELGMYALWSSAPAALRDIDSGPLLVVRAVYGFAPAALLLAMAAVIVVTMLRLRRHPAAIAPGNAVAGALWSGGILAMLGMMALFIVLAATLRERLPDSVADPQYGMPVGAMYSALPLLFWLIWAMAWWVWGLVSSRRPAFLVAAGALAVAVWYAATMAVFATSFAGLMALALLPGLWLIREARRTPDDADGAPA